MAQVSVTDPVELTVKNVDSNGKIYIGKDRAGQKAKIIIERFEENGDE